MMETKGRILLAEDDDHLRELVKDALEEEDYQVTDCTNGQEAIDSFDKNKFDICLLDIMMPVKDGFTVAKKIRQQSDVIPILFISTKALIEDKIEGYQRGADDYIVKPFNMKELLLKLDVFLRRTKKMFSETKQEYNIGKIHFAYTDLRLKNDDGVFDLVVFVTRRLCAGTAQGHTESVRAIFSLSSKTRRSPQVRHPAIRSTGPAA